MRLNRIIKFLKHGRKESDVKIYYNQLIITRKFKLDCLDNLGSGLVDYNDMVVFVYNSHSVRLHIHTTIYLNHLT